MADFTTIASLIAKEAQIASKTLDSLRLEELYALRHRIVRARSFLVYRYENLLKAKAEVDKLRKAYAYVATILHTDVEIPILKVNIDNYVRSLIQHEESNGIDMSRTLEEQYVYIGKRMLESYTYRSKWFQSAYYKRTADEIYREEIKEIYSDSMLELTDVQKQLTFNEGKVVTLEFLPYMNDSIMAQFRNLAYNRPLRSVIRQVTTKVFEATENLPSFVFDPFDKSEKMMQMYKTRTNGKTSPALDVPYDAETLSKASIGVIPGSGNSLSHILWTNIKSVITLNPPKNAPNDLQFIIDQIFEGTSHQDYLGIQELYGKSGTDIHLKPIYDRIKRQAESLFYSKRNLLSESGVGTPSSVNEWESKVRQAIDYICTSQERQANEQSRIFSTLLDKEVSKLHPYGKILESLKKKLSEADKSKILKKINDIVGLYPDDPSFHSEFDFLRMMDYDAYSTVKSYLKSLDELDSVKEAINEVYRKILPSSSIYSVFASSVDRYYSLETGEILIKNTGTFQIGPFKINPGFKGEFITYNHYLAMCHFVETTYKSGFRSYYDAYILFNSLGLGNSVTLASYIGNSKNPVLLLSYAKSLTKQGSEVTLDALIKYDNLLEESSSTREINEMSLYNAWAKSKGITTNEYSVFKEALLILTNELGSAKLAKLKLAKQLNYK